MAFCREVQDQGLVRPKVLILVPFRESAFRIVNAMIQLLVPAGKVSCSRRIQSKLTIKKLR